MIDHDVNFLTGFANILAEAVNTSDRNAVVQTHNRADASDGR